MTGEATQRWHFAGLDGAPGRTGPALDFVGRVAMVTGDEAVRQSIMLLLRTVPGERVMRPDYGCPLHRVMFGPNDATTAGLAIHYVRQALLRFEPRVEVVRLDAGCGQAGEDEVLYVWLDYRVKATQGPGSLTLALDLGGPSGGRL